MDRVNFDFHHWIIFGKAVAIVVAVLIVACVVSELWLGRKRRDRK